MHSAKFMSRRHIKQSIEAGMGPALAADIPASRYAAALRCALMAGAPVGLRRRRRKTDLKEATGILTSLLPSYCGASNHAVLRRHLPLIRSKFFLDFSVCCRLAVFIY